MARDIRIEEAVNGYVLRMFDPEDSKDIYVDSKEVVAANAAEVKSYVEAWLKKEPVPSKEDLGK